MLCRLVFCAIISICIFNIAYGSDIRLYILDCGTIKINNGDDFSDIGYYRHKPLKMTDPCYLIKHDSKWMLWDLGLGDKYVGNTVENKNYGVTLSVPIKLLDQLKILGLNYNNINYIGISHAHFDHVGNIGLFPKSTLLIQNSEYEAIQQHPAPIAVENSLFSLISKMPKELLTSDYDIFGDGSIVILKTPGHTIGHQSLEIKLPNSGIIILSGDLYHTRDSYKNKLIPVHNASRADTLASMSRIDGILSMNNGRLVIQHDIDDFNNMPKFPKYLN